MDRSQLSSSLPAAREVLALCAHPDDESFGLGAVLSTYVDQHTRVRILSLTSGEASTLGESTRPLEELRREELEAARCALGADEATSLDFPDGALSRVALTELACRTYDFLGNASLILVFDEGGVSGHLDHQRATAAGVLVASWRDLPVLAWTLPESVANELNAELKTNFVGRRDSEISVVVNVDRSRQLRAISCHASQSHDNPVLRRRLELLGDREYLRQLR